MADADTRLPVRALATDVTVEVANASGTTINPAEEFAQGSTTSGQKGPLSQAAVNTAAPTYVDGTTAPLTMDANGNLRVLTTPATGDQNINIDKYGGVSTTLGQKASAASIPVVIANDQSTVPVNETQVGGNAIAVGAGTTSSGTQRVVLPTDQSAIPVNPVDTQVELPQYNTAAAVAANASSTHSYTPGSTVSLDGFDASSSGQCKWEFQYGTTGSETTKVVKFTSKGQLEVSFRFPHPIQITAAMTVKLIRTNMDNQALDVYSTIMVH